MLKRLAIGLALSIASCGAASAQSYQDRQYRAYGWSGLYFGGNLGTRFTDAKWTTTRVADGAGGLIGPLQPDSDQLDSRAFRGGLYTGYNWQAGSYVWGVEGELGFGRSKHSVANIPGTFAIAYPAGNRDSMTAETGLDTSVRLRAGFLSSPNTLWYATGGLATQQAKISTECFAFPVSPTGWCANDNSGSVEKHLIGYTVGGGIESAFRRNWLTRLEYRFSSFNSLDHLFFAGDPVDRFEGGARIETHTLSLGLTYKY
jgi:outer membrane immunogenic protein